jgi:hypothetical protein
LLLLSLRELRVLGLLLLLLLLHEWCLAGSATSTTADEGIRRGEHYRHGARMDKTDAEEPMRD